VHAVVARSTFPSQNVQNTRKVLQLIKVQMQLIWGQVFEWVYLVFVGSVLT
jgi:hypothetical protein